MDHLTALSHVTAEQEKSAFLVVFCSGITASGELQLTEDVAFFVAVVGIGNAVFVFLTDK